MTIHSRGGQLPMTVVPPTKLWIAFVLGWLVPLGATGVLLAQRIAGPRLVAALAGLALLAALYLWVTLREALAPDSAGLRRPLVFLAAMSMIVVGLVELVPQAEAWWLTMHVIVAAGLALPATLAGWLIALGIGATLAAGRFVSGHFDPMLLVLIAFGAAAVAIRQLTVSVAQLHAAREELARAAVDQERLRFGRDLHDLLGHTVSVIILKSELAQRLLPASPDRAFAEIADVERAARDAMRQVRMAVAGYRQPVLQRELVAAHELLAAAGIAAEVNHSAGPLSPPVEGLLAWGVREGVTNVIRHSRAERCEIRLRRSGALAELTVTDDGPVSGVASPGLGHGLSGLAERAAAAGGEIRTEPHPGGFRLRLSVPAR